MGVDPKMNMFGTGSVDDSLSISSHALMITVTARYIPYLYLSPLPSMLLSVPSR